MTVPQDPRPRQADAVMQTNRCRRWSSFFGTEEVELAIRIKGDPKHQVGSYLADTDLPTYRYRRLSSFFGPEKAELWTWPSGCMDLNSHLNSILHLPCQADKDLHDTGSRGGARSPARRKRNCRPGHQAPAPRHRGPAGHCLGAPGGCTLPASLPHSFTCSFAFRGASWQARPLHVWDPLCLPKKGSLIRPG